MDPSAVECFLGFTMRLRSLARKASASATTGEALPKLIWYNSMLIERRRRMTMRLGGWFGTVSKSLRDGFFADNVVLALAKVKRDGLVVAEDRERFERAERFLADAIAGYQWIDEPRFTGESAKHASLFGQVVRALKIPYAPAEFVAHLEGLRDTAHDLAIGEIPDAKKIGTLREFFASHSRAEMEYSDQLFDTVRGRGGPVWKFMV